MRMVCAKVNFAGASVSTCAVDSSIERCENGKHIQGVESVFLLAIAVKIVSGITIDPIDVSHFVF